MPLVLVVDLAPAPELATQLEESGHVATFVRSAEEAKAYLHDNRADVIVTELVLPDAEGLLFVSWLTSHTKVPIMVTTVRQKQTDRVLALKLGADDVMHKPFDYAELEARLEVLLRYLPREPEPVVDLSVGNLELVRSDAGALVDGVFLKLTPLEYRALRTLIVHRNATVSHEQLFREAWGLIDTNSGAARTLHTMLYRLRRKLAEAGFDQVIVTDRQPHGLRLAVSAEQLPEGSL